MKCINCGAELVGKFCTVCGTPAQVNPVCTNCGAELVGKFCTVCGTPASTDASNSVENTVVNEAVQEAASVPDTYNDTAENTESISNMPEPMQYNPVPQNSQPIDYQQNAVNDEQINSTGFGQQFTNQPNGGYQGQQFTNQPMQNIPQTPKKGMSTGKIVALVLGIVFGVLILFGAIGVATCTCIGNAVKDSYSTLYNDYYNNYYDDCYNDLFN